MGFHVIFYHYHHHYYHYYYRFALRLSSNEDIENWGLRRTFEKIIRLNEWVHMKIEQTAEDMKYMFRIYQDNQQIFEVENKNAEHFYNVKVYVGNPWDDTQEGSMRKLRILNKSKCSTRLC